MDTVYKALADPTRRQILRMLSDGEKSAGDVAKAFDISAPSMSHHFNVLKSAELIEGRREGQQIVYSLNTTVVQELMTMFIDLFSPMQKQAEEWNEHPAKP
jgi:ArsR family transcriptional regulator, arsenate/arsenite/antimonite-responsive transcriptional repressor